MLRKILALTVGLLSVVVCLQSRGGIVAQYTFTGSVLTPTTSDPNATVGSVTSGAGLSGSSGITTSAGNPQPSFLMYKNDLSSTFNIANNDYISFVVTANSGWVLNLNGGSMTFDFASGANNKAVNWAVRSSVDSYGADIATGSTTSTTFGQGGTGTLTTSYDNLSSIQFRIYGWNPGNVDLLFDNITLNGVVAVPEPVNVALAVFALGVVGVGVGRWIYLRARA